MSRSQMMSDAAIEAAASKALFEWEFRAFLRRLPPPTEQEEREAEEYTRGLAAAFWEGEP